jgi:Spy/CpxP family protein refolding chaperone
MKSTKRFYQKVIVLTLTAICISTSLAYAEPFRGKCEGHDNRCQIKEEIIIKELGLTEEQQAMLKKHREACRTQAKQMKESLKTNRLNLRRELGKYDTNPDEIERISSEMKNKQAQLIDHRVASILKVKEILNPEQFEQFRSKIKELREKRRGFKGGCRGDKNELLKGE